jgi:ribosomal protein S18 acetylase RimI-like enzyme
MSKTSDSGQITMGGLRRSDAAHLILLLGPTSAFGLMTVFPISIAVPFVASTTAFYVSILLLWSSLLVGGLLALGCRWNTLLFFFGVFALAIGLISIVTNVANYFGGMLREGTMERLLTTVSGVVLILYPLVALVLTIVWYGGLRRRWAQAIVGSGRPDPVRPSMSGALDIRGAVQEDLDSLFELHRTVFHSHIEEIWGWDEKWQRSQFRREFESSVTYLVQVAGRTVGYFQTVANADLLYLQSIALHPDVQGQGIGTRLVRRLQREAVDRGAAVSLSIFRTNPRAMDFYRGLGFRQTGETDTHVTMSWRAA